MLNNVMYLKQSRSICKSILDYDMEQNGRSSQPRLVLSKKTFQPRGRQMIFQKDSPLTEIFNQQLVHHHSLQLYIV